MANDKHLYELDELTTPQSNDLLMVEKSSNNKDMKVKLSNLISNDIIEAEVDAWLDDHPEATTTVEDGSITFAKLHADVIDAIQGLDYYGMIIHQDTASPATRVEYTGINANFAPMSMGSNGVVNYGSWNSMPTIVKNRPAMVRWGETEGNPIFDYWLDTHDYTKKEVDGSQSDVSNPLYPGGAFAWFEPLWMKVTETGNDIEVRFAYSEIDEGYFEVCPSGCGAWLPMFYSAKHSVSGGKATSIAGLSCLGADSTATQWADIQAASPSGLFLGGKLVVALYYLGCMWFKTTNSDAWGCGNRSGYNAEDTTTYGTKVNPIVDGGQFYATSDSHTANKFLHSVVLATYDVFIRDPYTILDTNIYKVSLDYHYDATGATYYNTGISAPTNGYPKIHQIVPKFGGVPTIVGGSTSTYYCDYFWVNAEGVRVGLRLGNCSIGAYDGGSSLALYIGAGYGSWYVGFALFLKQRIV